MDFVDLINDQGSKISASSPYLKYLWSTLTDISDADNETSSMETRIFLDHLPINLHLFLKDCIQKLQQTTIDWSRLKLRYLLTLLYWSLLPGDKQGTSVNLTAAELYLALNMVPEHKEQLVFYDNMYYAILNCLENCACTDSVPEQAQSVVDRLREFLKGNELRAEPIMKTAVLLNKICGSETWKTHHQFKTDEPSIDLQHAALICIKVLLQQLQQAYERNKEIILYILFTLTSCFSHQTKIKSRHANTPKYNITQLLKDVYKEQAAEKCPLLITIKTLAVHPDFVEYDDMVGIVCDLDYSVYSDFCWWTAEGLVCNQKDFRKSLPNLAIPIAVHTHRNQTQEKKNALLEVLLNNLMKLCGDRNIEIAECALRSLETFISLNDATVKSAVKHTMYKNVQCMYALLHTIRKHIDKKWQHRNSNRYFINIICKLFVLKKNTLDAALLKDLDEIFMEASPMDLRPCLAILADFLKCASGSPSVADVALKCFVKMSLSPVGLSNHFASTFYDVLFKSVEQHLDSKECLDIADLLISQNYDHKDVFKKFHSLGLLTAQKLKVLINYKVSENPKALKLIYALIDFIDYDHFEALASYTRHTFQQKTYEYADLLFYILEKILGKLSVPYKREDSQFIEELSFCLENELQNRNIPISCSSNAIALFLKLEKSVKRNQSLHFLVNEFEQSLFHTLTKVTALVELELFEVCRAVSYLGDFLLLSEEMIGERTIYLLRDILRADNVRMMVYMNNHPDVWILLIVFFTKLSIKKEEFVEENIFIIENALVSENENVRFHAVRSLEDMCNYRFNCFQTLVPHVFKFIQENNTNFLVIVCVRIINKLISEDHIVLDEQQYITLTALLAHKNDYIRMKIENILRDSFLVKCQRHITKFFVLSIIYYNKYKLHHDIHITQETISFSLSPEQRRHIYKFLFDSLVTSVQFSVVNEMTVEILTNIVEGKLIRCTNLLADCIMIIELLLENVKDDVSLNELSDKNVLKDIQCIINRSKSGMTSKYSEYQAIIMKLVMTLLNLTFQVHLVNTSLRPVLIKLVLKTTKVLLSEVVKIVTEGCESLREAYMKFVKYHEKYRHILNEDFVEPYEVVEVASCSAPSNIGEPVF